jgi:hypothetical protein
MFALRIIEEMRENENAPFEQVIENYALGNYYSQLRKGSTKEFDQLMKENYPEHDIATIKAIIIGENKLTMFVKENTSDKQYSYFIMTENGKTFERIH